MSQVEKILKARKNTHGNFTDNSKVSQDIKSVLHGCSNWTELLPFQKEALEMISHKIGRILEGDPNFKDHWDDICGYSKLVADRVEP